MKRTITRQSAALGLALGLAGLLLALGWLALRAGSASAAGLAEPATAYPCSEAGLDSALAAGGSATFSCGAPTVVHVSARKTVAHSGTLDGGDKLILSGSNVTAVFTVAAGVHLNLLNLTLRDASDGTGAAVYNNGVTAITHVAFISNTAALGAALYNAPGATASLVDSSVISSSGKGGAVWNGASSAPFSATLTVAGTRFVGNLAGDGGALFNDTGYVTITNSSFTDNNSFLGGAIYNNARLSVDNTDFDGNTAFEFIQAAAGPALPGGLSNPGGGAIYASNLANTLIRGSRFNDNLSGTAGGAIYFGDVDNASPITDSHRLSILLSSFAGNCTTGAGGAVAGTLPMDMSGVVFQNNHASPAGCGANQAALAGVAALAQPQTSQAPGLGGAIFTNLQLTVSNASFIANGTVVTPSQVGGWGGAIANTGRLTVDYASFTGNTSQSGEVEGGGAIASGRPSLSLAVPAGGQGGQGGQRRPQTPQIPTPLSLLSVDHSTFTGNSSEFEGGALDAGPAVVSNSTFINNSAAYGGAIDVLNVFTVTASTFAANAAVTTTANEASQGGAIDTNGVPTLVQNSTFYNNHARGGAVGGAINVDTVIASSGPDGSGPALVSTLTLQYSTFLSNSVDSPGNGAVFFQPSAGLVAMHDALIAYNVGGDCNAAATTAGANLEFGDASCGAVSLTSNPLALAPANNGGPTPTSALLPGSPAIDGGDNLGCPATDQRGAHRPTGAKCDLGAYEFGALVARLWLPIVQR